MGKSSNHQKLTRPHAKAPIHGKEDGADDTVEVDVLRLSIPLVCPEVASYVSQFTFETGAKLDCQPFESEDILILATGAIREEIVLHDGRRQVVGFLFRGDSLADGVDGSGLQLTAIRPGVLYRLPVDSLSRCRCNGLASRAWYELQHRRRLGGFSRHIMLLGRYSAEERLADFLDGLLNRIGVSGKEGTSIHLAMSREDIADYLGLKSETISRQLGRLKNAGIITMPKPGHIMVKDRTRLSGLLPAVSR